MPFIIHPPLLGSSRLPAPHTTATRARRPPFCALKPKRRDAGSTPPVPAAAAAPHPTHRTTPGWACIKSCGACCFLDPSSRPGLDEFLTAEQLKTYLGMVGEDGWCVNFVKETRECGIFETRPEFCRASPESFVAMYGMEEEEFDGFATKCCVEQIGDVYGEKSKEMVKFKDVILELDPEAEFEWSDCEDEDDEEFEGGDGAVWKSFDLGESVDEASDSEADDENEAPVKK